MRGPTSISWASLTPFLLQHARSLDEAASLRAQHDFTAHGHHHLHDRLQVAAAAHAIRTPPCGFVAGHPE